MSTVCTTYCVAMQLANTKLFPAPPKDLGSYAVHVHTYLPTYLPTVQVLLDC